MINLLRALMERVDSMQEEEDKEGKEACILKERTQKIHGRSKNPSKKGESCGRLISRRNRAEERLSECAHLNRKSEGRKAKRSNFERNTGPNMQGLWDTYRLGNMSGETAEGERGEMLCHRIVTENLCQAPNAESRHWRMPCRIIIPSTYA